MKKIFYLIACCLFFFQIGYAENNLQIYFVDVMGGGATLIVTPANESILIDSGWKTDDKRDAMRIKEALNDAGLNHIDYSITTHWHRDHFGSIPDLSELVEVEEYYDKGIPETFPDDPKQFTLQMEKYKEASENQSKIIRPGEHLPLEQVEDGPTVDLLCLASDRDIISTPSNFTRCDECKDVEVQEYDETDNAASLAFRLSYGDFDFFIGGDITWNIETELVCPFNKVGQIDLYMANHHGFSSSNNPVFLKCIEPTVAIVANGPNKGASPAAIERLKNTPSLKHIYQIHWNVESEKSENTSEPFIANVEPGESGTYIKAVVAPDAKNYQVVIGKDGVSRSYQSKE